MIDTYFDGKIRNHGNLMLTINRWHPIPGLVRSQDYSRITERLSHAAAPTHREQPVSILALYHWFMVIVRPSSYGSKRVVAKYERSLRVGLDDSRVRLYLGKKRDAR